MSLTLVEARARARALSEVSYRIELDLTDPETFGCRTVIGFRSAVTETFLELHQARAVQVSGAQASYDGARITLTGLEPAQAHHEVVVEARLPYVSDGEGMHEFVDPADGERYVGAYCGMDLAQRIFPCFDQNDLKAPITLSVIAPPAWTVLANGREVSRVGDRWSFATTPLLPPALFIMVAGPLASVRWEHAGLGFGWHARASLAPALTRDADWLRQVTEACFDHYAGLFTEPYPFDSYDQVFVPGLNWGAQEQAGCVSYRDEFLPIGEPTEPERRDLAMVIAHEMAHMWFGDLATMTWWEDTWLQESFADYLGFRVAAEIGVADAFADFTVGWKPRAYRADERRSTHPVAPLPEDVPDVEVADGNFDALSYAKGNSLLRQLVTWLGDEVFFAGVNAYLTRFRFANATLADFIGCLDAASDRDVRGWAEQWLRTTGFDTVRVARSADGFTITRDGSRAHRLRLASYDAGLGLLGDPLVDLGDQPVAVPSAAALLPNSGGETYARIRPDAESWAVLSGGLSRIADPTARAIVWTTAFDLSLAGELDPLALLELIADQLPAETHPPTVQDVLAWAREVVLPRQVRPEVAATAQALVASACRAGLETPAAPGLAALWARALALTCDDAAELESWLARGQALGGAEVDPRLRWLTLRRLAALGAVDAARLAAERHADGTVIGVRGELAGLAARPDADAKADAWARMFEDPGVANRDFEALAAGFWSPEHSALLAPWVTRYAQETVGLCVARGRSFASLAGEAFPALWLSRAQIAQFEEALTGEVPTGLRRSWADSLDDARLASG